MKVVFTGGGTAGHVLPNVALIEAILKQKPNWIVTYIGSNHGLEKELLKDLSHVVQFYGIYAGKLRRYFSFQNFLDGFKFLLGILQALWLLFKLKPNLVFSKGGFVGLPVTIAAKILGVPVIVHESDLTPGLANRLAFPWAAKILLTFEPMLPLKPNLKAKTSVVGLPMRQGFKDLKLLSEAGSADFWFKSSNSSKPMLLIFGGSLGAVKINEATRSILPKLLERFKVLHVCGANNIDPTLNNPDYQQYEFIAEYFPAAIKAADVIVARAGATSIYEFLYFSKPHLLVPLETNSSRGDQLVNAKYFEKLGTSTLLRQAEWLAKPELLIEKIDDLLQRIDILKPILDKFKLKDATPAILEIIEQTALKNA